MAKKAVEAKAFTVVVAGQYFTADKKLKRYEVEAKLPSPDRALTILKDMKNDVGVCLLDVLIQAKYPDAKCYRTHTVVSVAVPEGHVEKEVNTSDINQMSRAQLEKHIISMQWAVNTAVFPSVADLREAVGRYLSAIAAGEVVDKEGKTAVQRYEDWQAEQEIEFELRETISDLNPQLGPIAAGK